MDLTRVVPTATPLPLGGVVYLASELRLADLAELQAWINAQVPSPFDLVADVLAGGGPTVPGWLRLLGATIDAQAAWPKVPGDPEAEALLQAEGGRKLLLALVLRRHHPDADVGAIYAAATVAEYSRLHRVAWGVDPGFALGLLIDGPGPGGGRGPDWARAWFRYVTECKGGPPFGDLTISQFRAFRSGGKAPGSLDTSRPDWLAIARRREAFFAQADTDETAPVSEETADGHD